MSDVIAVFGALWVSLLVIWIIKCLMDEPEEFERDRDICDGCIWGWCMCVPGDRECQKHRKERGDDGEET